MRMTEPFAELLLDLSQRSTQCFALFGIWEFLLIHACSLSAVETGQYCIKLQ
jgi:hypothetical protein